MLLATAAVIYSTTVYQADHYNGPARPIVNSVFGILGKPRILAFFRIFATVRSKTGADTRELCGELLFTKYGLSGTVVIDASGPVSVALNREGKRSVDIEVDLDPFLDETNFVAELERRSRQGTSSAQMLAGILPNKVSAALGHLFEGHSIQQVARILKGMRFNVSGTQGWNEAEFTAGGVDVSEVDGTGNLRLHPGLYFAGEVLDVDGERGRLQPRLGMGLGLGGWPILLANLDINGQTRASLSAHAELAEGSS